MEPYGNLPQGPPAGYLSEEAKKKYTITAGVLAAIFFFGQMILPFGAMMVAMPGMMKSGAMDMKTIEGGAYWNGQVWYIEKSQSMESGKGGAALRSITPGAEKEPGGPPVVQIADCDPKPLPAGNLMWLVCRDNMSYLHKSGDSEIALPTTDLGNFAGPFLDYSGRPAVVQDEIGKLRIMTYTHDGDWEETGSFSIQNWESIKPSDKEIGRILKILNVDGEIYLFLNYDNALYYRRGMPSEQEEIDTWELVPGVKGAAGVVDLGGAPAVYTNIHNDFKSKIEVYRLAGTSWIKVFSREAGMTSELYVLSTGGADNFILLRQGFPGSFAITEIEGGEEVRDTKYGGSFPFGGGFMGIMAIPYSMMLLGPLALALILASLMKSHRVLEFRAPEGVAGYASISRRAGAQIIDGGIMLLPAVIGYIKMFRHFGDMDNFNPLSMMSNMGMICGGFCWSLVIMLVYSLLEGSTGQTPGKKIFGIQTLGVELKPCGFGRAFLRNLLMFVDGFFNCLVGVILIAFTENWQRVGDLAARTIVVRVGEVRPAAPAPRQDPLPPPYEPPVQ